MKRGQVTLFVVLGIVIFAVIALLLYARQTIFLPTTPENLRNEMENVNEKVISCLANGDEGLPSAKDIIIIIGKQGGYLDTAENTYVLYAGDKISYLCFNIQGQPNCYNRMLTSEHMEKQISDEVKNSLSSCLIDIKELANFRPYEIITGDAEVNSIIRDDDVLINVNYPVTLKSKRSDVSISKSDFNYVVNLPLGILYDAAQDILDVETEFGTFEILTYMLSKKGEIKIYPKKPYPDKVYTLKKEGSDFVFQFAVQDEPS